MLDYWQGDANLLWRVCSRGQEAVVKQFLDAGQARSRRQFDGHQFFAPFGIAPIPLWADRHPYGLSRQLIVYQWVEGDAVQPNDPSALWAWAEAVGTLHTAPASDVHRFSPHPLNLDFYWRIEQASIAQIATWLETSGLALTQHFAHIATAAEKFVQSSLPFWAGATPTAVHGDLSLTHVLLERGRAILLDWEMFGLGDPALDVARLIQREEQSLDTDQIEQWLDRYQQIMDQPGIRERIHIFQQLLEVHNVVYLLVGLQQHIGEQAEKHIGKHIDDELRAALPFVQETIATSLQRAGHTLHLSESPDTQAIAAEFIDWLIQTP